MASAPLPFNVDEQYGSLLIGLVFDGLLYGVTSVQVYLYWSRKERSRRDDWLMWMVFALWLLDTLHLAMVAQGVYWYTITKFASPAAVLTPTWGLVNEIFVTAIINGTCQAYMIITIWQFATAMKNHVVKVGIFLAGLTSLASFCVGLAFGGVWHGATSMLTLAEPVPTRLLYTELTSSMVCDILIAACSVFQLLQSRTGFKKTNNLIDTLILYSINTCVLTSGVAVSCFAVYVSRPESNVTIALYCLLSKFYFNSLMSNVNGRAGLRKNDNSAVATIPLSLRMEDQTASHGRQYNASDMLVNVHHQVETHRDLNKKDDLEKSDSFLALGPTRS